MTAPRWAPDPRLQEIREHLEHHADHAPLTAAVLALLDLRSRDFAEPRDQDAQAGLANYLSGWEDCHEAVVDALYDVLIGKEDG